MKKTGFRRALRWAEKMAEPITAQNLQSTGWEFIDRANGQLHDLLSQICTSDALIKVDRTPGDHRK